MIVLMSTEPTAPSRLQRVGKLTKKIADMLHETERVGIESIESIRLSIKEGGKEGRGRTSDCVGKRCGCDS